MTFATEIFEEANMSTHPSSPREMFVHELSDILTAERTIEQMLEQQLGEASDAKLKRRLERHHEETRKQVENLEQAFDVLGEQAEQEPCPGIEGIKTEHEESRPSGAEPEMTDLFLTSSAARVEHYEIAAYEGLLTMAEAMEEKKVMRLLERNLKQEQRMLQDAQKAGKQLAAKAIKSA
jgi:ferritin-like metal-binding protein YciE